MRIALNQANAYTLFGVVIGLCFPVGGALLLYWIGNLPMVRNPWQLFVAAHHNPLLFVIDTAPLCLGFAARLAGLRQDRLLRFSQSLEREVKARTASLQQALADSRKANAMVSYMADHDPVTGLTNRRHFQRELERWIGYAVRYQRPGALLFIDVDRFKGVNDLYGHRIGDLYLKHVGQLVVETLRVTDIVARWGGDEFAVLLPEITRDAALTVVGKLLATARARQFTVSDQHMFASLSIGIALFPEQTALVDEIVLLADAAMYDAKATGGDCARVYSGSANDKERIETHLQWEGRIRRALDRDQFVLHYQPVMRLTDGVTVGYEALLRMEDIDGLLVNPPLFLRAAESFGLSLPIDRMVIRKVAKKQALMGSADIFLSINLSWPSLLDPRLIDYIAQSFSEAGNQHPVHFEIPENIAISNTDAIVALAAATARYGSTLILDDFRLGVASLDYLRELPFAMVKIDAMLVSDLASNEKNQASLAEIADAAHAQGCQVTAKRIEDASLFGLLASLGVDCVQGYSVGRPMESLTSG